jgi:hypothetical protein
LNLASEAPQARKRRSVLPIVLGLIVIGGAAAAGLLYLRPDALHVPGMPAVPQEARASEPAAAPAAAANPSAPSENPAPTAAAEPQAQAAEVSLPVNTTPAGAEVVVDGHVAGTTPTTVKLRGGANVTLSVRLRGYVTKTEQIAVAEGLTPRDIALQPIPYVLAVTTDPPGATVTVGSQTAETPLPLELEHVEGALAVNVQLQGYAPVTRSVRVEDFHEHEGVLRAEFTLKLTPLPASASRRKGPPAGHVVRSLEPPAPGEAAPGSAAPPEPPPAAPEPEAARAEPSAAKAPAAEAAKPAAEAAPAEAAPAAPKPAVEPAPAAPKPEAAPPAPAPQPAAQ